MFSLRNQIALLCCLRLVITRCGYVGVFLGGGVWLSQFTDVEFLSLQEKEKERKKRMEAEKSKRKPVVDINAGLY